MKQVWFYLKSPDQFFGVLVPRFFKKYRPFVVTLVCVFGFLLSWFILRQSHPTIMATLPVVAVYDGHLVLDQNTAWRELKHLRQQGKQHSSVASHLFEGNVWVMFDVPKA